MPVKTKKKKKLKKKIVKKKKKKKTKEKTSAERRIHFRFPTITIVKEVVIAVAHPATGKKKIMPAIMYNLSAGGIAIVTFDKVPTNAIITLNLDLGSVKLENVSGKVVRVDGKNITYLIAIDFIGITKKLRQTIKKIADDADLCETRILLGEKHVCSKKCGYFELCTNPMKRKAK